MVVKNDPRTTGGLRLLQSDGTASLMRQIHYLCDLINLRLVLSFFFLTSVFPASLRVFGFVAKKPGSMAENVCHLFAELDPEQPASAIVNFINKVMLSRR